MLPIIARWNIADGKREEALLALQELARIVEEQEPFVPMYTIHTPNLTGPPITNFPTPAANEVIFLSVFDDYESFQKHMDGVFHDWLQQHKDLFLLNNGNLFVIGEWLVRQAGFIRPSMVTTGLGTPVQEVAR